MDADVVVLRGSEGEFEAERVQVSWGLEASDLLQQLVRCPCTQIPTEFITKSPLSFYKLSESFQISTLILLVSPLNNYSDSKSKQKMFKKIGLRLHKLPNFYASEIQISSIILSMSPPISKISVLSSNTSPKKEKFQNI